MFQPSTSKATQTTNASLDGKKRLCGAKENQKANGSLLASFLTQEEVATLFQHPEMKRAAMKVTNKIITKASMNVRVGDIFGM